MRWSNLLAQLCVCSSVLLVPFVAQAATEEDPWESVNRPIYKFNDVLDTYALKPLAQGYQYVTPQFVEDGIHNFFRNIGDVRNLANNVLQAKPAAAGVDTARLIFNTTFGLLGFIDVGTRRRRRAQLVHGAGCSRCPRQPAVGREADQRRQVRVHP